MGNMVYNSYVGNYSSRAGPTLFSHFLRNHILWNLMFVSVEKVKCGSIYKAFVRMELHQPVSLPPLLRLKVFLEFFVFIFCSDGEVYDGVVCKQPDCGVFAVLCHVVYVDQEEARP